MSNSTVPLSTLAQQLAAKLSELESLRAAYDTRLADLRKRKQELEETLAQVDAEIQAASQEAPAAPAAPTAEPAAPPPVTTRGDESRMTLPQTLVHIVTEKGRAVTVKELAQELVNRKFPTTSGDVAKMVGTRVTELIRRGLLARASGQPGVVLPGQGKPAKASNGAKKKSAKKKKKAVKAAKPEGESANGTTPSAAKVPAGPSLRTILLDVLTQATAPLRAKEIADKVLATGYQTKSKVFSGVVGSELAKMENVENIAGQGYRLKPAANA